MEKQINEKIIEMDREYPFLFCFKSDFWMEQQMIRQNIFEHTKRQTPKMTFVYVLRQPLGSLFYQKVPMSNCMPRLVRMIAIQQRAPRRMDFPLDLIIAMRFVLRPIALIAMMMRNLESCLRGAKKLLLTPKEVRTVVSREARIKQRMKTGKIFLSFTPWLLPC